MPASFACEQAHTKLTATAIIPTGLQPEQKQKHRFAEKQLLLPTRYGKNVFYVFAWQGHNLTEEGVGI